MEKIILTTKDELETLIQNSFRKVFSEQSEKQTEPKDAILNIEQASQYLNLAKQTLYGFTSKNEIPFIKKGKKLYFRKSELEQWLSEGRKKTLAEYQKEAEIILNNRKSK